MTLFKSDATKGICIMIWAAGVLSMNDAATKYLAESYPMGQVLGLRQSAALLVILAYVWWSDSWRDLRVINRSGQA